MSSTTNAAMQTLLRPWRLLALGLVILLTVGGCATLDSWQRQAIFQVGHAQTRWYNEAPEGTERFDLVLANGHRVHAWYLPAREAPEAAPTALYLHGSRWNLHNSVFRLRRWHELGFNMLAIDYRGFGDSTTILPSESSAYEDVLAALAELKRREPDPAKRFVYGHSLGGALAIRLAADAGPELAGAVIESSFTNIADLAANTRWGWLPGLNWLVTQRFDSLARVGKVEVPLLFVHGTADRVVPHEMSDQLHAASNGVRGGLKKLLKIDGASHSGVSRAGGETYARTVHRFVAAAGTLMAESGTASRDRGT
jgi:alpha-beta hydrolase superfamily lysophospholipase